MARIKKEDQTKILAYVNEEHRPVRAVAAEFGCTPAAIYALLVRSRRDSETGAAAAEQPPLALTPAASPTAEAALPGMTTAATASEEGQVLRFAPSANPALASGRLEPAAVATASIATDRTESRTATDDGGAKPARRALGARLAKPGVGLVTRSADGDESMMPFRSLDDLLSAIKPILREGARSSEPVWFSIQPIDLATIDADAA